MREIKFRAWDCRVYYYSVSFAGLHDFFKQVSQPKGENDVKLEQYTGIKDKWGNEIYEGDILKNEYKGIRTVFWNEDDACFSVEGTYLNRMARDGEIIGNIHESEHLLDDTDMKPISKEEPQKQNVS